MVEDEAFATQARQITQQIIKIQNQNISAREHNNYGRDQFNIENMQGSQRMGGRDQYNFENASNVQIVSKGKNSDSKLFAEFLRDLPSNKTSMIYLKDWCFGAAFPSEVTSELRRFTYKWQDAEHEFLDKKLEAQRKDLICCMEQFLEKIAMHVLLDPRTNKLSIGMDDFETRPEMWKLRDDLNAMASKVYAAHQKLIRIGRENQNFT